MPLTKPFEILALELQEAASSYSHSDVRSKLEKAVQDAAGQGGYGYVMDVYGDDQSGDVVHRTNGKTQRAPYAITDGVASIGSGTAVMPRTVYEEEPDADDHFASMMGEALYSEGPKPLCERFVSKDERDQADSGDFAGKGKSFPILKPEDVSAAARSLGRAGTGNYSPSTIKAKIISIAKRKGWTKYLPKAWQSSDSQEAQALDITGDCILLREGAVGQDGNMLVCAIKPGWGSSGYYSKEVLKRDGPKQFRAGTKMFWNHQTAAEEAARPEGNLDDWAATFTDNAYWDENGPEGPALYAKANAVEHYRKPIDSLAKHMGVSIRAAGKAKNGKAEGKTGPIIEELTHGISVDFVTTPGAGGKVVSLFEAARRRPEPTEQEHDMTESEVKALIEAGNKPLVEANAALKSENAALRRQTAAIRGGQICDTVLSGLKIHEAAVKRTRERVAVADIPLTESGAVDEEKLKTLIEGYADEEQKHVVAILGTSGVRGMGAPVQESADELKALEAQQVETQNNILHLIGKPKAEKKEAA